MSTVWFIWIVLLPHLQDRHPVPNEAALQEAEKLVREVFKDDYAKKTPSDRTAFFRKLLKQGLDSRNDPAPQFVLFSEARDIAATMGDLDAALAAVAELEKAFTVDTAPMKSSVLLVASRSGKTPEEFQRFARAALQLAADSAAAEQFDLAEKAADFSAQSARKAKDLAVLTNAAARMREYADLRAQSEKADRARGTLEKNAGDPEANLLVGRYLCFVKGDWDAGLPHLAKGNDGGLKTLAARDGAKPADPADQVALGDAWWEGGELDAARKTGFRQRALFWYGLAREKLTGLSRARIEKRFEGAGVPLPVPSKKIPLEAQTFGGHAYKLYTEHKTWQEAKEFCEKLGGHLVTITSKEEGQFVCTLFPVPKETGPWIGLSYDPPGKTWKWVTGEPVKYSSWAPAEPNYLESEHWVEIAPRGIGEHWNNVPGLRPRAFVCEWER